MSKFDLLPNQCKGKAHYLIHWLSYVRISMQGETWTSSFSYLMTGIRRPSVGRRGDTVVPRLISRWALNWIGARNKVSPSYSYRLEGWGMRVQLNSALREGRLQLWCGDDAGGLLPRSRPQGGRPHREEVWQTAHPRLQSQEVRFNDEKLIFLLTYSIS